MKSFLFFSIGACFIAGFSCADEAQDKKVDQWMRVIDRQPFQCQSLHEAARYGDVTVASACLEMGQSVNMKDELGNAPLHLAIASNHSDVVEVLLKNGADVMLKNAQGKLPVELTSDELILKICSSYVKKRELQLSVIKALESGDAEPLKNYLYRGGDPNVLDAQGRYPLLYHALSKGNYAAAQLLIKADAALDGRFDHGKSYLMIAASSSDPTTVKLLLKKGADPMHQSNNGATALHDAVWAHKNDNVEALLPAYKSVNYSPDGRMNGLPIFLAIARGNVRAVELILACGIDVNAAPYAAVLLNEAVKKGHVGMVKAILQAGANPDAIAPDGKSAHDHAQGKPAIAELLKKSAK